jgi:hypothetical protein
MHLQAARQPNGRAVALRQILSEQMGKLGKAGHLRQFGSAIVTNTRIGCADFAHQIQSSSV